jgi:hypothetical protein
VLLVFVESGLRLCAVSVCREWTQTVKVRKVYVSACRWGVGVSDRDCEHYRNYPAIS